MEPKRGATRDFELIGEFVDEERRKLHFRGLVLKLNKLKTG
jgi:hypothetical protein